MCHVYCPRVLLLVLLCVSPVPAAEVPDQPWWPKAPPLPAPRGEVIRVETVEQLFAAVEDVRPGGTVLLEEGHYRMPRYLELRTDDVTLRGASGRRDRVILDGVQSRHGELVGISGCSGVTIADLTIQNIKWNGFKINSNLFATNVTIRNCVIHNVWQRGVKGPAVDEEDRDRFRPTDCRIQYCLFYNDRPKQFSDDPADTPESFGGNYIGGIDAMHARRWVISDNVFLGIHGRTGEGRGAIFLWNESEDCVVERNVVVDCDTGICLGNPHRNRDTRWHDRGCVVRNNFVTRCSETGMLAAYTRDCLIAHNTIHDPSSKLRRLIWVQQRNDNLVVAHNLLSGPRLLDTGSSEFVDRGNIAGPDLSDIFLDATTGNLRLLSPIDALDRRLDRAVHDIDGQARPPRPMPGAHQFATLDDSTQEPPGPEAPAEPPVPRQTRADHDLPPWVEAMRRVHAGFDGQEGYVAQFGDSITYSMAFWSVMGWCYPDRYLEGHDGMPRTPPESRWRDVLLGTRDKGPKFGNYSGWRVGQLLRVVDGVLERERPEVAIIMIGTNDISGNRVPENYAADLAEIVEKCLAAHCVPLLSTIPPRRGHAESVEQVNGVIRDLAGRERVPLVDFHTACLERRPGDSWEGTLISTDGVHPTGGETHVFTAENLKQCGYALRNWMTFLKMREIYFRVLHARENSEDAPGAMDRQPDNPEKDDQQAPRDSADTWSPRGPGRAGIAAPRVLAPGVADTYSMRTFGRFARWRDLAKDAKAYEIYRYLADKRTGVFHMNVVAEGDDGLSEFVQVRDPVKIINVYGYAYCGILGPVMAGVCEGVGLGPARTLVLPAWNHVAAETYYDGGWHYLDLDVRAAFRRSDGTLASLQDARQDPSLWRDRGPLFFPNDPLRATREIYEKTDVQTYHGFHQFGHTMDYVLRPGERFIRWWQPQGGRWHHLARYNDQDWLRELIETPPRGPKPNHRHFTEHDHGNGKFLYEPRLTEPFRDFDHGTYGHENLAVTAEGVTLVEEGVGCAVFEIRSPYVIVPQVGQLETIDDDREASVVQWEGRGIEVSISLDNGLTWQRIDAERIARVETGRKDAYLLDLTREVAGGYGYLLKLTLRGRPGQAVLGSLKITTWVQVAPASLPALQQGRNEMKLVAGDHYGLPTRVVEVRSRASRREELLKYLLEPPADYDPGRRTERIRGSVTVRVDPPPGTRIAWFTATGQFRTHQRQQAVRTNNRIAYAANQPEQFQVIYEAEVPTYTNHWHYNAGREVRLERPIDSLFVRYTGDPALNNFAVYAHCLPERPPARPPVVVTHRWREGGEARAFRQLLKEPATYVVTVESAPVNESIELAVPSVVRRLGGGSEGP